MIGSLLALAAGYGFFLGLSFLFIPHRENRQFWTARVLAALVMGLAMWKLTPLWTRWGDVLSNPVALLSMNGGPAALFGGLFAFFGVLGLSLFQLRSQVKGTKRWPFWAPVLAGLALSGTWFFVEPLVVPRPGSDGSQVALTSVPDLSGAPQVLGDLKGRVVVLNFWATWCPPCRAELPEFRTFAKGLSDRVALVSVNAIDTETEGLSAVRAFVEAEKMPWTHWTDPGSTLGQAFAVTVLPTTVVLGPDGKVVDRREGTVDLYWLRSLEGRFAPAPVAP